MGNVVIRHLAESGSGRRRASPKRRLGEAEDASEREYTSSYVSGLAQRLRDICEQATKGHPFTMTDRKTVEEVAQFLESLSREQDGDGEAPDEESEEGTSATQRRTQASESAVPRSSSEQLDWLRSGQQAPERRPLRQPAAAQRNPAVSRHLAEGTVPQGTDDQLRWLFS